MTITVVVIIFILVLYIIYDKFLAEFLETLRLSSVPVTVPTVVVPDEEIAGIPNDEDAEEILEDTMAADLMDVPTVAPVPVPAYNLITQTFVVDGNSSKLAEVNRAFPSTSGPGVISGPFVNHVMTAISKVPVDIPRSYVLHKETMKMYSPALESRDFAYNNSHYTYTGTETKRMNIKYLVIASWPNAAPGEQAVFMLYRNDKRLRAIRVETTKDPLAIVLSANNAEFNTNDRVSIYTWGVPKDQHIIFNESRLSIQ